MPARKCAGDVGWIEMVLDRSSGSENESPWSNVRRDMRLVRKNRREETLQDTEESVESFDHIEVSTASLDNSDTIFSKAIFYY